MTYGTPERLVEIASMYDRQADVYTGFKEASFSWRHIEAPAFDRLLSGGSLPDVPNLCQQPELRVLDLCCGAGLLAKHLISCGVQAENIIGVDISAKLIAEAQATIPGSRFLKVSADSFELPAGSIDVVVSNMGLHLLDNEQLAACLELTYNVLAPDGTLCFVDADSDYNEETRDPANANKWLYLPTPWGGGGTAPWFSRSPHELLLDYLYFAGFDLVAGGPLPVSDTGRVDPEAYQKYTSYPARMGARLQKVSETEKLRRLNTAEQSIPTLWVVRV